MGDLNEQNQNGKLFEQFVTRNASLNVVNALPLCEGKYTRVVNTKVGNCKTIIDFFVVCDKILPHVTKMTIDEKGEHALTKYKQSIVKTDHNMLTLEVDLGFHNKNEHERIQMFNLRNKACQQQFKEFTSKTKHYLNVFSTDETVEIQFQKWHKKFQKALHSCFRKIRITNREKKLSKLDLLMKEKKEIIKKRKLGEYDKEIIDEIDRKIGEECEDKEWKKLMNVLGSLETDRGDTNNTNVWRELRKAFPNKTRQTPTGVMNIENQDNNKSK